jgi:hypothetical protein
MRSIHDILNLKKYFLKSLAMIEKITPLQLSKTFSLAIVILLAAFSAMAQEKPELKIGGALRFNYNLSSRKDGQKKRGGDFGHYNDVLAYQVNMPLYTISAWPLMSIAEGSVTSFVVSLSSDVTSQLPPLRLTNASRQPVPIFIIGITPAHKGPAPSR